MSRGKEGPLTLGQFEHEVLMALFRLQGAAYTVSVQDELKTRVGKNPALGTISVTLSRLERRGLAESALGEANPRRRGRPKRLYQLTALGARALNQVHAMHRRLWEGLDRVPVGEGEEG